MPKKHLTEMAVKKLKPINGEQTNYWDTVVPRLVLRVNYSGSRTWSMLHYLKRLKDGKPTSTPTYYKLGRYPVLTLKQAREQARQFLVDPERFIAAKKHPPHDCAAKFQSFIDNGIEPVCYLYRHYHPNGDLLYVGVSLHLYRQYTHSRNAEWRKQVQRIELEPFATREEALEAERLAIDTEFPKFNTAHNERRSPWRALAHAVEQQARSQ
jgi:hypothetical protein